MFEQQQSKPIRSCFFDADTHASLKRALLEVIASGKANTKDEIAAYIQSTFFYACLPSNEVHLDEQITIEKCLDWLHDNELIRCLDKENVPNEQHLRYEPTPLALAIVSSSVNPDDGLKLVIELSKAQRNLCLENDLHLIYLVSPSLLLTCRA